jgi:hypothetical protein
MRYTLLTLALTAGITQAATLATGELHTISGQIHQHISLTWSLEDDGTFSLFNEGQDGVVTMVNFDSSVMVSAFEWTDTNKNLPQGNSIGFVSTYGFKPVGNPIHNGIDVGESSSFMFSTLPDQFTVGVHVQSIGGQDLSDTYVASYTVPEPSSCAMLGLTCLGFIMRKRR